jgi:hypothetical protein
MTRLMMLAAVLGLVSAGTGCATLRGSTQKLKFETEPTAANLTINGQRYTTPAVVELKRKESHRVLIEKEGYRPVAFNMESTWDGAAITDLAVPGGSALVGMSAVSGSDRQFYDVGKIKLEKATGPNMPALELYGFRGKLMTKPDYDRAVKEDAENKQKFMGPENN